MSEGRIGTFASDDRMGLTTVAEKVEVEISTIWALSDFTEDVGPTRGVRRFCSNFVHTVS